MYVSVGGVQLRIVRLLLFVAHALDPPRHLANDGHRSHHSEPQRAVHLRARELLHPRDVPVGVFPASVSRLLLVYGRVREGGQRPGVREAEAVVHVPSTLGVVEEADVGAPDLVTLYVCSRVRHVLVAVERPELPDDPTQLSAAGTAERASGRTVRHLYAKISFLLWLCKRGRCFCFAFRICIFFVLFCHVLFILFCVLLYCLMHASVCFSYSEALTSLTSSLQALTEINYFDQLVTKTYPRLRRFNR